MLLCDTSGLFAYFDADAQDHEAVNAAVAAEQGALIVSPYVVAELDYLLASRGGLPTELAAFAELAGGAWELASLDAADLAAICGVIEQYGDQDIGAADGSIVRLAGRHRTNRVLTLDRRHFEVLRTPAGKRFEIVPG